MVLSHETPVQIRLGAPALGGKIYNDMFKLVVGNWKLNPPTFAAAEKMAAAVSDVAKAAANGVKVIICPPFVWLRELARRRYGGLEFGAQDVFWKEEGAYTGEISPLMLKNCGAEYVIVGHSERRRLGETDKMINQKVKAALRFGLKPILCVGEDRKVRRRGIAAAKDFVKHQLQKDLTGVQSKNLILAYEPLWAISTVRGGSADTPEDAAKMIQFIKSVVSSKVLYGGSVTSANVLPFFAGPEVDGVLVGGASIKPAEFKKIIKVAAGLNKK